MNGLFHVYCGEGKGKTSAAVGLSLRATGSGMRVLFVQFFKDGTSSEIAPLRAAGVQVLCERRFGRGEAGARAAKDAYQRLLEEALARAKEFDLLVLDEGAAAFSRGCAREEDLLSFLEGEHCETVLTGRAPSAALLARADYCTEMRKVRHPFDAGVRARCGIEF